MTAAQAEQHAARANVYRTLADCFRSPAELEPASLPALPAFLQACAPGCAPAAEALLSAMPQDTEAQQALQVAHAALFVGPFELLAPPYGSVYLDEGQRVMGDSTLAVGAQYAAVGLSEQQAGQGPPDHIATELEFMYYLAFQQVTREDPDHLYRQAAFLTEHLALWVPPFTARIREAAQSAFYTALAELTARFVAADVTTVQAALQARSA